MITELISYRHLKGYKYESKKEIQCQTDILKSSIGAPYCSLSVRGILRVFPHYAWDGPSGPTFDTDSFMRGSLFHDALYQLIREGVLDKSERGKADMVLRTICLEDGMCKFRAWYVYRTVRVIGIFTSKPRKNPRGKAVAILRNTKGKIYKVSVNPNFE